jgi:hypothetical protein
MHMISALRAAVVLAAATSLVVLMQGSARGAQPGAPPTVGSAPATVSPASTASAPVGIAATAPPTTTDLDGGAAADGAAAPEDGATSDASVSGTSQALTWAEGFTTPDAPALTLIGANASKIQEPGSAPQFGVALLNSVSPQGTLQSGLALELTGRAFGAGNDYAVYATNRWVRFLSRLSLSVATAQSTTVPTTMLGSVGLRIVFVDGTDSSANAWGTAWSAGEMAAIMAYRKTTPGCELILPSGGLNPAAQQCANAAVAAYVKANPVPQAPWNAWGLSLAGATSAAFANGALSQASAADTAAWLTASIPLGGDCVNSSDVCFQMSASAQYTYAAATSENIGAGAVRFRGGSNLLRGSIEADYATENPNDPDNRKGRVLVGLDIKLTTGTWLNASLGGDYNFTGSPIGLLSLASLKYAFASSPDIQGPVTK